MNFFSLMLVTMAGYIAFRDVRSGKDVWQGVRDGVLDAALFQAVISAVAVSFALAASWPLIVDATLKTAAAAAAVALGAAVTGRLVPQRRPVTYW